MTYTVYFWPTPNGKKITIMLEELGAAYDLVPVDIGKGDQHKPEFLKISPNNKMPALVDPGEPGGKPLAVFESGAILQYLGRKHGAFYPKVAGEAARVDQWLFFQVGSIGPMSGQTYHFRNIGADKEPYAVKRFTDEIARLYGVMNRQLAHHDFIAGDYSIADMALYPWIMPEALGQDMDQFPHLAQWMSRMSNRSGVMAGMDAGKHFKK